MKQPLFKLISYSIDGMSQHDLYLACEADMKLRKIVTNEDRRNATLIDVKGFITLSDAQAYQSKLRGEITLVS